MDHPALTKTETVLRSHANHNWYYEDWDRSHDAETRGHVFVLDRNVWDEMGRPREITVTVEPGDRLNS